MAVYIDDLVILILLEAIVFLYGLLFIGWLVGGGGGAGGGLFSSGGGGLSFGEASGINVTRTNGTKGGATNQNGSVSITCKVKNQ